MNRLQYRSALLILVALVGISVAIASLPQARAASTFVPHPFISPTVCTTDGVCFEVDNSGHGISVEGQALNKRGVGVRGLASSTTMVGTGVSGQAFGPSSIAVNGVAFSTDSTRASEGVDGLSANGNGVDGATTFNSTLAITAASGVLGRDRSTAFGFDTGVEGISTRGVGVAGISENGNALTGSSTNANGIVGQTSFFATSGQGRAGVLGQDLATPNPFGTPVVNVGVEGSSIFGTALSGVSTSGVGVSAFSGSGTALTTQSNNGYSLVATGPVAIEPDSIGSALTVVGGEIIASGGDVVASGGPSGGGMVGGLDAQFSAGSQIAIEAFSQSTPGPAAAPTLYVNDQNGGPIMLATDGSTNEMSLDGSGNMILAGTLTQNGNPMVAHRKVNGWGVATYSAQQTMQTIEDVGESQLVAGEAYVQLDSNYARLLNPAQTYLVFLTAQGDCRGLFVAQKNHSGFEVREMSGGRSSVAFDYRIVGQPLDGTGQRLPIVAPLSAHHVRAAWFHSRSQNKQQRLQPTEVRAGYVPRP